MSLPKYIINFDELAEDLKHKILKLINNELNEKISDKLQMKNIEDILNYIKEKMPSNKYKDIIYKINKLFKEYKCKYRQEVEGRLLNIPAIQGDYKEVFKFKNDVLLTGLHFNQTGWKKEDKYRLEINSNKIINKSFTKEIGEHKYFNTFYKVDADTPISFILENNSGNSRQTMVDLEYLKLLWNPEPCVYVSGLYGFPKETYTKYELENLDMSNFYRGKNNEITLLAFDEKNPSCYGGNLGEGTYVAKERYSILETLEKRVILNNYSPFDRACYMSFDCCIIKNNYAVDFYMQGDKIATILGKKYVYSKIVKNYPYCYYRASKSPQFVIFEDCVKADVKKEFKDSDVPVMHLVDKIKIRKI